MQQPLPHERFTRWVRPVNENGELRPFIRLPAVCTGSALPHERGAGPTRRHSCCGFLRGQGSGNQMAILPPLAGFARQDCSADPGHPLPNGRLNLHKRLASRRLVPRTFSRRMLAYPVLIRTTIQFGNADCRIQRTTKAYWSGEGASFAAVPSAWLRADLGVCSVHQPGPEASCEMAYVRGAAFGAWGC